MTQVFNPNPELVVPTGIPTIEAQAENEKKKKKKYIGVEMKRCSM